MGSIMTVVDPFFQAARIARPSAGAMKGMGGGGFFDSSQIRPLRVSLLTLKANGGIHYGGSGGET